MKLLAVAAHSPFPPRTGSAIVAYNNLKELSKRHSIYFICRGDVTEAGDLIKFVEKIEFINPDKIPFIIFLSRFFVNMLFLNPLWITACMSRKMQERVREVVLSEAFDAILLFEITTIQYCPPSQYGKAIVHLEDPISQRHRLLSQLHILPLWKRAQFFIDSVLLKWYENKFCPRMAKVFLLSKVDMQDMQKHSGFRNLKCLPYGADKKPLNEILDFKNRSEGMIVFSGNMFHPPNIDGILFFLKNIFPLVLKECPKSVLWVVGAEPDIRIRDAAERFGANVVITGKVSNISEYLKRAKVSICPIRMRIGVQTKILEALSWGTPVVTTSAGNSGIVGRVGYELWIEDEPEKFAHRVVALLRGEDWNQLSVGGRKFVEDQFSWERSARELEQQIMNIQN